MTGKQHYFGNRKLFYMKPKDYEKQVRNEGPVDAELRLEYPCSSPQGLRSFRKSKYDYKTRLSVDIFKLVDRKNMVLDSPMKTI